MSYVHPSPTSTRSTSPAARGRAFGPGPLLAVVLGLLLLTACLAGAVTTTSVVLVLGAGLAGWLTLASTTGSGM